MQVNLELIISVIIAQDYTDLINGQRWEARGAGPGNEGYLLIGAGIPILCGFGPIGGNLHTPDEWVDNGNLFGVSGQVKLNSLERSRICM